MIHFLVLTKLTKIDEEISNILFWYADSWVFNFEGKLDIINDAISLLILTKLLLALEIIDLGIIAVLFVELLDVEEYGAYCYVLAFVGEFDGIWEKIKKDLHVSEPVAH